MTNLEQEDMQEVKKLLVLATLAGRIMLTSGAETYRVEDTVQRICRSKKEIKYADAFVIPTGIFISLEYKGELVTYIQRIKSISTDLHKVDMVNDFSRAFVMGNIPLDKGIEQLKEINKFQIYSDRQVNFSASVSAAAFVLLFKGTYTDSFLSFIVTFLSLSIVDKIKDFNLTFLVNNLFSSMLISAFAVAFIKLGFGNDINSIIIGGIMPLVPGVAMTTAIRDAMSGDYLSGLSRGMEAIFSALAIALGVGIVLNFYMKGVF